VPTAHVNNIINPASPSAFYKQYGHYFIAGYKRWFTFSLFLVCW
jgi:GDP-D-mannose dehydratase